MEGSSPRVRGTLRHRRAHGLGLRFIPACAGNSAWSTRKPTSPAVHPRVCGELWRQRFCRPLMTGSSPRVRGTRAVALALAVSDRRFIPACAGNSSPQPLPLRPRAVHPRVCGELLGHRFAHLGSRGSSPRVRGTPGVGSANGRHHRFIPACAGNSVRSTSSNTSTPVHPRVCGELGAIQIAADSLDGSSPRVRGTRPTGKGSANSRRFIPACAGNSKSRRLARTPRPVHPRVCGELDQSSSGTPRKGGSSPRVRGTRAGGQRGQRCGRFIPACAGNSGRAFLQRPTTTVHPRVCGELHQWTDQGPQDGRFIPACAGNSLEGLPSAVRRGGSSPRVRGTPRRRWCSSRCCRFIPACAGNSVRPSAKAASTAVHPRVCGELAEHDFEGGRERRFIPACAGNSSFGQPARAQRIGSSPRVRGTRGLARIAAWSWRFIPACAGNSASSTRPCAPQAVHPRVCGELVWVPVKTSATVGSSPRVRGTRRWHDQRPVPVRFIPACAGNSGYQSRRPMAKPVHPRVCGELRCAPRRPIDTIGSSPRVRGTPVQGMERGGQLRFIPACAGNSLCAATRASRPAVHPRVCGELRPVPMEKLNDGGSSPRVRGTPTCSTSTQAQWPVHPRVCGELCAACGPWRRQQRFIPACAGNSHLDRRRCPHTAVHPRVCGELWYKRLRLGACGGSSPRVRGTLSSVSLSSRTTPVHPRVCGELGFRGRRDEHNVGSSPRVRGTPRRSARRGGAGAVHPRVCGELQSPLSILCIQAGSSPRVRGTRHPLRARRRLRRFIPACAGNSAA